MNPPVANTVLPIRRVLIVINILLALLLFWIVLSTIHTYQTTGELTVKTDDPQSSISITQPNHNAVLLGRGTTHARLQPGTYELFASAGGRSAIAAATIIKSQTTTTTLTPGTISQLPTRQNITYSNTDDLLNAGLPSAQLNSLEGALFHFKPTAKTMAINPNTIGHNPQDPASSDPTLNITFTIIIDGTAYHTVTTYAITTPDIHLYLYNPTTNALVFDSGVTT